MSLSRTCVGLGLTAAAAALILRPADAQPVPTDAQPTCAIAPGAVAAMFASGSVTLNGLVKPADSTVSLDPPPFDCPFFAWSEQMFLWLTSPVTGADGRPTRVMFSPSFFTVSPPIGAGSGPDRRRNFIVNQPGAPIRMLPRATELGPHMLPAVMARTGQVVEVVPQEAAPPAPPMVRLRTGATARLGNVRRTPGGELQFLDPHGRRLEIRRPALPQLPRNFALLPDGRRLPVVPVASAENAIQARRFQLDGIPIFLDANDQVIDVEPGQADNGVLLSQNNSLVYYIITVNDVFAYHRTMRGPALIPDDTTITFPLTMADANAVAAFAASHGARIDDPQALAIETKSSWVEASAVPNPEDYVQVEARIPVYDTTTTRNVWVPVPGQERTVRLVMVGLHVVGSTRGHGEMVWATFEHVRNAPNATYSYDSTSGPKTVTQLSGAWVFAPNPAAGPFNIMHARLNSTTHNIEGWPPGSPVASTPVMRTRPWGADGSDDVVREMNTKVISANASVIGQLAAGDVRANYFQIGTTWTIFGAAPTRSIDFPGNWVGTNRLANATMETFVQRTQTAPGSNCFTCHRTNTVAVSHIYRQMNPLF